MEIKTSALIEEIMENSRTFDAWHGETVNRLQRQASHLREQAGRLLQAKAAGIQQSDALTSLEQERQRITGELDALRDSLASRDTRITELQALEAEVSGLREKSAKLDEAEAQLVEKESKIAELEALDAQLAEALDRVRHLEKAAEELSEKERLVAEHASEIDRHKAELADLQTKLDAAEEIRAKAELEKKLLMGEVEGLDVKASESSELRARIAKLEEELAAEREKALKSRAKTPPSEPAKPESSPSAPAISVVKHVKELEDILDDTSGTKRGVKRERKKDTDLVQEVAQRGRGRGPRRQLGDILVDAGIITKEQLDECIRKQTSDPHKRLGHIIVDSGYATEDVIAATLAAQMRTRFVEDIEREATSEALRMVPQNIAANHRCVPLAFADGQLIVALANPLDLIAIEDLQHATGAYIEVVVATPSSIDKFITKYYSKGK